jgi:hypothetical protein
MRRGITRQEYFWFYLPYALVKMPSGDYLPVNRRYKPLGLKTFDRVEYADYPAINLTDTIVQDVAINTREDSNNPGCRIYWLYNDRSLPWRTAKSLREYKGKLTRIGIHYQDDLKPRLSLDDHRALATHLYAIEQHVHEMFNLINGKTSSHNCVAI